MTAPRGEAMTDDLLEALRPLLARLEGFLASHPELRKDLAAAARAVAARLDPGPPQADGPEPVRPVTQLPPSAGEPVAPPLTPTATPDHPPPRPTLAAQPEPGPRIVPRIPPAFAEDEDDHWPLEPQSPGVIAARCRVKADAARLIADRLGEGPATGVPLSADLQSRAADLPECRLWMLFPGTYSESRPAWVDLSRAYLAAAATADLLQMWLDLPEDEATRYAEDVLPLAAEGQAILYAAVAAVGRRGHDQDQLELFVLVREETRTREVYIRRYFRKADRADPAAAVEFTQRVADLTTTIRDRTARTAGRRKHFGNLQYKLGRMKADPQGQADEWSRVLELIDKLVGDGLPPSNAELRDMLLPVIDHLPAGAELTRNVGLVFREIGRFLDTQPEESESEGESASAEVEEVARLIGGRELVLIGGQARPHHRRALIRAFRLADLDWIVTPDHESYTVFEPAVRRPATAVVVLAIRWSNHSYAEVQTYCTEYGKPLVRLPAGYNPNQMAHQILTQVGDQLRNGTSG